VSARQDALKLDIGDALLEEGVIQARLPGGNVNDRVSCPKS
jgi:hypothetical protein